MKLSIIIPTYNREEFISKCIDSVTSQTYDNIEIIIVDDGSTDNTEKIIQNYTDERIKYFKNKNHGIGFSRNYGLNKAVGDYILFLDSDDYLDYDAAEKAIKLVKNNDILIFDYKEIFEKDGREIINKYEAFNDYTLKEHPDLINTINLGPCNKIFKKEFLDKNNIRFPEDIKYEDTPFIIKSFKEAKKISSCGISLTNIMVHKGNETLTVDERVFDILKVFDKVKEILNDKIYDDEIKKLMVKKITTYTVSQRTQKNKKLINKFINEAFKYLKANVPDYKKNKYYENRSFLKRTIEKNKALTKIYCKLYKLVKAK